MPLLWTALGFVLGVFLSREGDLPLGAAALLVTALGGGYLALRSWGLRWGLPLLLAAGVVLGLARGGTGVLDPPGDLDRYHGREVQVTGVVTSYPELFGEQVRIELDVEEVRPAGGDWSPADGALLAWAAPPAEVAEGRPFPYLAYGDRLVLAGRVAAPEPFSGFDYPRHLASQGIGSVIQRARVVEVEQEAAGVWWLRTVHRVRGRLARSLAEVLPEPQAAVAQTLLLGLRGGVPPDVSQDFRQSGTAHLLAISGLHVGIVLALGLGLSRWFLGRRRSAYLLVPLALMWAYALLAGASPSAVRASIMGTAYLLALATGRGANPLNALAVAAAAMVAWEPRWLWHLSFQLSFTAMAGVLLVGLPMWQGVRDTLARRDLLSGWRSHLWAATVGAVLVSLGAVLGSLPLVAFNFHQVPVLGIPTTLAALPVLPGLLLGGISSAVLGLVWAPLGWAAGWVPWLLGWYLTEMTERVATVSWAVVEVERMGPALVWGYYALLTAGLAAVGRDQWLPAAQRAARAVWRGPSLPHQRAALLLTVALLVGALWLAALSRPDGRLHLYFLDVGQGDALLVRTPGGFNLLVDGGPDARVTIPEVDRLLPVADRDIDVAVLSHPHANHLAGLMAMARRGRLERVVVPPPVAGEEGQSEWRRELEQLGVEMVEGSAGVTLTLRDGVWLEVVHPPLPLLAGTSSDVDNNGLVVLLRFGQAAAILPGDLRSEGEGVLLDGGADIFAQVLQVAHHGSDTSSTLEFLETVRPAAAVTSVGAGNPFGHPSPEVVARLRELLPEGALYRTDEDGTVELTTDGTRWWVKTHR